MSMGKTRPNSVLQVTGLGARKLPDSGEKWADGRARRGRGTSAARRCMNFSAETTGRVVPSRHGVFSFSTTCPAALHCTRRAAISSQTPTRAARQASRQAVGGLYAERAALAVFTILAWASRSKISCVSRLQIAPVAPPAVESAAAATPSG